MIYTADVRQTAPAPTGYRNKGLAETVTDFASNAVMEEHLFETMRQTTDTGLRELARFLADARGPRLSAPTQLELRDHLVRHAVRAVAAALREWEAMGPAQGARGRITS